MAEVVPVALSPYSLITPNNLAWAGWRREIGRGVACVGVHFDSGLLLGLVLGWWVKAPWRLGPTLLPLPEAEALSKWKELGVAKMWPSS